jgi:hypothetical protein
MTAAGPERTVLHASVLDASVLHASVLDGSVLDGTVFLTARRHVDYGRVRSAMCPAY